MKKLLIVIALLLPGALFAQKKAPKTFDLIIGTYTKGTSRGIQVYRFYTESGRLAYLSQVETSNPSYLCISNDRKFVYAVNEEDKNGNVSAFSFEPVNGILKPINTQPSKGDAPCYISEDKDQKHVFVANYSSGNLTVLPVNKDGSLQPVVQSIQDEGHGPNAARQEKPHVHTAFLSPDEKYVFYTDLGTDKLNVTRYKPSEEKPLTPESESLVNLPPGSGPRHIDFSPDHRFAYLVAELSAHVFVYEYHGGGKFKQVQMINIEPEDFKGEVGAADIHVSADGRFVYATDRGAANDIVTYAVDPNNGHLIYVDRVPVYGKTPRNFTIDPTGNFLLVANQNSDDITVFKRNPATGKLVFNGYKVTVGNPVCLKFTPAQ